MLRPLIGDLVLGTALPVPDPQLPEAVVDDRLTAEPRPEGCRRLHGTGERARHKPVDRLLTKDIGDRRGGPTPCRLDALVEPTHRPALAVRGGAAVADEVDASREVGGIAQSWCRHHGPPPAPPSFRERRSWRAPRPRLAHRWMQSDLVRSDLSTTRPNREAPRPRQRTSGCSLLLQAVPRRGRTDTEKPSGESTAMKAS